MENVDPNVNIFRSSVIGLMARMLREKNALTDPLMPPHTQIAPALLLSFGVVCPTRPTSESRGAAIFWLAN